MPDTFKAGERKGSPTCSVLTGSNDKTGEEYWMSFGYRKAKAILENVDEIEAWCIEQEEKGRK